MESKSSHRHLTSSWHGVRLACYIDESAIPFHCESSSQVLENGFEGSQNIIETNDQSRKVTTAVWSSAPKKLNAVAVVLEAVQLDGF